MLNFVLASAKLALRADRVISTVVAASVIWLNYYGAGMQGILPHYLDFKRIILAGFDPSVATQGTPTFPMWGYGWLMLITENKLALLLIQMTLALAATQITLHHLETTRSLSPRANFILRWVVALAVPWYAFHALRWPYSIAICLFLLSMVCLDRGIATGRLHVRWILTSGALFGIMLNFRSDYFLMPLGFAVALIGISVHRRLAFGQTLIWLTSVYAMLIPWTLYTWKVTGHPKVTSTNSGHVAFIGLGNLPHNKWGISAQDDDPVMHRLLAEKFYPGKTSLDFDADCFLRDQFLERVKSDPQEYARKCVYAAGSIIVRGPYVGEFLQTSDHEPTTTVHHCLAQIRELLAGPAAYIGRHGGEATLRLIALGVSFAQGWLVVLLSYCVLPAMFVWSIIRRNVFFVLASLAILYQTTLQILVGTMAVYTANLLFLHLINAVVGVAFIVDRVSFSRRQNPERVDTSVAPRALRQAA